MNLAFMNDIEALKLIPLILEADAMKANENVLIHCR